MAAGIFQSFGIRENKYTEMPKIEAIYVGCRTTVPKVSFRRNVRLAHFYNARMAFRSNDFDQPEWTGILPLDESWLLVFVLQIAPIIYVRYFSSLSDREVLASMIHHEPLDRDLSDLAYLPTSGLS